MFSAPKKNPDDTTLEWFAHAYTCYSRANWDYARADAGIGGFLVDRCLTETLYLKSIISVIGKGLVDDKADAKSACLLFEKIYKEGFNNQLYQVVCRERFKELLPQKSIERLNQGEASMADCIKSICFAEQILRFKK